MFRQVTATHGLCHLLGFAHSTEAEWQKVRVVSHGQDCPPCPWLSTMTTEIGKDRKTRRFITPASQKRLAVFVLRIGSPSDVNAY